MACQNQVGVKNILISFEDCDTGEVIRNVSHKLATDELPMVRACAWTNEELTNGYVQRNAVNATISISVIRDPRIALSQYQSCASISIQIEYFNGLVYTAFNGSVTTTDGSDTHAVTMDLSFSEIDELLPASTLTGVAA